MNTMKSTRIFNEGLALSALPAATVVSYAIVKNVSLDGLFFFVPFLLGLPLIGFAISYFSLHRISKLINHTTANYSATAVIFTYAIFMCLLVALIYSSIVRYEIPYGFILLPLLVDISGAILLVFLIFLFNLRRQK